MKNIFIFSVSAFFLGEWAHKWRNAALFFRTNCWPEALPRPRPLPASQSAAGVAANAPTRQTVIRPRNETVTVLRGFFGEGPSPVNSEKWRLCHRRKPAVGSDVDSNAGRISAAILPLPRPLPRCLAAAAAAAAAAAFEKSSTTLENCQFAANLEQVETLTFRLENGKTGKRNKRNNGTSWKRNTSPSPFPAYDTKLAIRGEPKLVYTVPYCSCVCVGVCLCVWFGDQGLGTDLAEVVALRLPLKSPSPSTPLPLPLLPPLPLSLSPM